MNKFFLFILTFTGVFHLSAQDLKKETWEKEKDLLKYEKKKDFKGPEDWYSASPSPLSDHESRGELNQNQGRQGVQYSPQRIAQDRERKFGKYRKKGGKGTFGPDPEVKRPDPVTLPEIDPPDVDLPDVDLPQVPLDFWRIILFIVIFAAVVAVLWYWLKNRRPGKGAVVPVNVEDHWNPQKISRSELEVKLEEATSRGDYRECVRIYFTFILKELIERGWINWKKEKTNHHYVNEMISRPEGNTFRECVRIYDLVWYGEYEITRESYAALEPILLNYYKTIRIPGDKQG